LKDNLGGWNSTCSSDIWRMELHQL